MQRERARMCPHRHVAVRCPKTSEVARFGSLNLVGATPPQSTLLKDVRRETADDRSITIHAHQAMGLPNGSLDYHTIQKLREFSQSLMTSLM